MIYEKQKQNKNYRLNILGLHIYSSLQSLYCVGGTEVQMQTTELELELQGRWKRGSEEVDRPLDFCRVAKPSLLIMNPLRNFRPS